ncbi:MAG: ankyrin repeat domain-containing protein [Burkholderiales bacterium]|nr:ankyrin repeat domain-containing protein [Burkholderiales bacterium]
MAWFGGGSIVAGGGGMALGSVVLSAAFAFCSIGFASWWMYTRSMSINATCKELEDDIDYLNQVINYSKYISGRSDDIRDNIAKYRMDLLRSVSIVEGYLFRGDSGGSRRHAAFALGSAGYSGAEVRTIMALDRYIKVNMWAAGFLGAMPPFQPLYDENGLTPHCAAGNGQVGEVRLLLDKGADVNAHDGDRRTPLHYAANQGHADVAQLLLDKGANVNARDGNGWTALHHAANQGNVEVVRLLVGVIRLLLDKGADINASDGNGRAPLHYAAFRGHADVVRLLLNKGANVNARDGNGWTALHDAANYGQAAAVQLLLDKGGSSNARSNDGRTPLGIAAARGYAPAAALLRARGGRE